MGNDLLFIWYNPNTNSFYSKYSPYLNYKVGYINSYGHMLVNILYYDEYKKKLVSVKDRRDLRIEEHLKQHKIRRKIRQKLYHLISKI